MKKIYFLIIIFSLAVFAYGQQFKVEMEGNAAFGNSSFTVAEAGEDFSSGVESETSVFISVLYTDNLNKKKNPNEKWNIKVFKSDLNWNDNLTLEMKRTGSGENPGNHGNTNIHDGENYLQITNTSTYFFSGRSEIAYIPVALRISGVSIAMGAETFETNVVFTVYDDW